MPPWGIRKIYIMLKLCNHEFCFEKFGITNEEEKNIVLGYIRELFAIAIQYLNNEEETVEAWI